MNTFKKYRHMVMISFLSFVTLMTTTCGIFDRKNNHSYPTTPAQIVDLMNWSASHTTSSILKACSGNEYLAVNVPAGIWRVTWRTDNLATGILELKVKTTGAKLSLGYTANLVEAYIQTLPQEGIVKCRQGPIELYHLNGNWSGADCNPPPPAPPLFPDTPGDAPQSEKIFIAQKGNILPGVLDNRARKHMCSDFNRDRRFELGAAECWWP